ncbi:MAG: DinB family protein [Chloroflexi bacterium]|nr:DinB family protein [Chloroflexota bacterium]
MIDRALWEAVERFAGLAQGLTVEDLECPWAWGAYDSEGVRMAFFRTYEELREVAVITAAHRLAIETPLSSAARALAQYHAAYRDLQAVLLGVDDEFFDEVSSPGEWSLRQVVSHIGTADIGFYVVVRYALDRHRTGNGRPADISDEAWDAIIGAEEAAVQAQFEKPFAEVWAYLDTFHRRIVSEFSDISEEELAAPSTYWEGYPLSLRFRLHRFDSHMRQHTVQAEKALVALGRSPTEARRLLRLIYNALAEAEGATIGAWDAGGEARRQVAAAITARTVEVAALLPS